MAAVTTYSKRKPVQQLVENVHDIFEEKGPFSSDSSIVDKPISSHQKKDQNLENNNQCTDTSESDRSDKEVFLSLSKSLTLKRKRSGEYIYEPGCPSTSKKTSKFAEHKLFQDPVSRTPGCKHQRTRRLKAGTKKGISDVSNIIKEPTANKESKATTPQQLLCGRLATRKPIKSPRLQPPRYVNTYRAPEGVSGPDCESQERESSQESGPWSQPTSQSPSADIDLEEETSDLSDYTFTYTWATATGSTDAAHCPSIELPRRQVAIQEHVDPPTSPLYLERDAKERNFDNTDVSDISQTGEDQGQGLNVTLGEDCGTILNSTLLDDGCAKNIQDVVITISPIHEYCGSPKRTGKSGVNDVNIVTHVKCITDKKEANLPTESLMEMKGCLETTPQAKKSILSPKTPLKVRSAQSKVGKLQPKSSTFIFAEDEHKHIREYITHELSEIPKLNDRHKTSETGFSPELKVIEQEFLTSTPMRGPGEMGRLPREAFSVDLSTVQAQSLDSNELQFHTSRIVNSAEIHVSSPDDINTIPDTCDELMHSPSISIPDVEVDQVCLLETMPFQPVSVKTNDKPKEELEETPPLYQPAAYPLCVIVSLPEMTTAPKESRILQWHNPSTCSYRTMIKNTPIDIFEAFDV